MKSTPKIIDPFQENEAKSQRIEDEKLFERLRRLARYAQPGSEIGIPWHLFEQYIEALDRQQAVTLSGEWRSRRSVAAPIFLSPNTLCSAAEASQISHVYPVIT